MFFVRGWYFSKLLRSLFIVLCLCVLAEHVAAGKIYKWRDADGRLHFSDSEQYVPSQERNNVKEYTDQPAEPISPSESSSKNKQAKKPSAQSTPKDDISIPFEAYEGSARRVIINVTFNGKVTAPILVDTGSPGLMISVNLANRLGLFSKDSSFLFTPVLGIGGFQLSARAIIDKITIGDIEEKFIPVSVIAESSSAYDGLLGMDILSNYTVTIDSSNNQLIANLVPEAKNLPGGRNRSWWSNTFREFNSYKKEMEWKADLAHRNKPPFSKMDDETREFYKDLLAYFRDNARDLYQRLENYARWNEVPVSWRK